MFSKLRNSDVDRRRLLRGGAWALLGGFLFRPKIAWARRFLEADEARELIWGDIPFTPLPVTLTRDQMTSIRRSSGTRVRSDKINSFRSAEGHWFILDQVIGKHENIDIAVGLTSDGKVKGIEVLVYRESYGHEIMNPKWRAQFHGRDSSEVLRLDRQITNIGGATLSCRHITDGINRLTHTWDQVLRNV